MLSGSVFGLASMAIIISLDGVNLSNSAFRVSTVRLTHTTAPRFARSLARARDGGLSVVVQLPDFAAAVEVLFKHSE